MYTLRARSVELASIEDLRIEIQDLKVALGIIHTREAWDTASTLEEAKKLRRKDESQEVSG